MQNICPYSWGEQQGGIHPCFLCSVILKYTTDDITKILMFQAVVAKRSIRDVTMFTRTMESRVAAMMEERLSALVPPTLRTQASPVVDSPHSPVDPFLGFKVSFIFFKVCLQNPYSKYHVITNIVFICVYMEYKNVG